MLAGVVSAHAAEGVFYDPSNAASSSGKTTGYELYRTIGCPGKGLLDAPCQVPKEVDTDGDGIPDSKDKCPTVYAKTADGCPAAEPVAEPAPVPAPAPAPAPVAAPAPKKLVLEGVNFDHDKATLREDAHPILDQAAEGLKEWGDVKVEVAGYTDSRGKDKYNLKLSQRRAEAVRAYLIGKGIAADRLTAKGFGETRPVADNKTAEGRFKNRRVELIEQK
ncbi:MAG: OmpA family protein [Hydrogenophilales bacterium]|nr:OmpA family protein [Hydrogenophilales bacterium]